MNVETHRLGNMQEKWGLQDRVSRCSLCLDRYSQYFGDDGEVGEVGEYLGDEGDIWAGEAIRNMTSVIDCSSEKSEYILGESRCRIIYEHPTISRAQKILILTARGSWTERRASRRIPR